MLWCVVVRTWSCLYDVCKFRNPGLVCENDLLTFERLSQSSRRKLFWRNRHFDFFFSTFNQWQNGIFKAKRERENVIEREYGWVREGERAESTLANINSFLNKYPNLNCQRSNYPSNDLMKDIPRHGTLTQLLLVYVQRLSSLHNSIGVTEQLYEERCLSYLLEVTVVKRG